MGTDQIIPVLERAVSLLGAISNASEGLSAKRLSMELKIPSATCYRILRTFMKHGWLQEDGEGNYRIGFGLAQITRSYASMEQKLRELKPVMQQITDETGLSAKVSVREGEYAVSVARTEALLPSIITFPVGAKIHLLEAGSTGAILLGTLNEHELNSLIRKVSAEEKKRIIKEMDVAKKERIARSYGTNNPSIHAVSILVDVGCPAALSLVGWKENFSKKLKNEVEKKLKNLF